MPKRYCPKCKKETEHEAYGRGFLCANYSEHKKYKLSPKTILKGVILTELGNLNVLQDFATLGSIIYDVAHMYYGKKPDTQNVINAQIALEELGVKFVETDACCTDFEWSEKKQDALRLAIDKMVEESEKMGPESIDVIHTDKDGRKKTVFSVPMESQVIRVLKLNKRGIGYLKRLRSLGFRF